MKKFFFYWRVTLILFLVVFGCTPTDDVDRDPLWPDIDLSLYQSYPIGWHNVLPAVPTDYWELRSSSDHKVSLTVGDKCSKAQNPQACTREFDTLRVDRGFGNPICRDAYVYPCEQYIVSNHGNDNRVWDTLDKLKEFLGAIDSKAEALLLAEGHGFFTFGAVSRGNGTRNQTSRISWGGVAYAFTPSPPLDGGVREIDGEYELIVQKTISVCSPRHNNRYLIRIKPSSELVILREQINERGGIIASCP